MASDDAVIATNDDAAECKRHAVEKGYWVDPYISLFIPRGQSSHAPEINRGYYVRVMGIKLLLDKFLKLTNCNCQVISLGAGYDTTFWRLKDENLIPKTYVEVDFSMVTSKKCHYIKSKKTLLAKVTSEDGDIQYNRTDLHGPNYHLVAADLRHLTQFVEKLQQSGIDYSLPTVFIAECVLVYIDSGQTKTLVKWISDHFKTALFINYEQVNMGDRFGEVMIRNLRARDCDLYGLEACQSIDAQKQRFLSLGWHGADAIEMIHLYKCLPRVDIERIEKLEFMDERELLDQLYSHYCVCWAYADAGQLGLASIDFS